MTAEQLRLEASNARVAHWKRWGPYLSERAWGTVREDYSADGDAWEYFPHDHARSRAYRWNEDGLAGICDRHQNLCFALALWNGRDPILKERLFGLTGPEGNHGEDVKEYYFYLDSTPTHSYMKYLYKYPQAAFPYAELVAENRAPRPRRSPSTSCSTPACSTTIVISTSSSSTPRPTPEDILMPHLGRQSRPDAGVDRSCCRRSGSATRGRGAATPAARAAAPPGRADRTRASIELEHRSLGDGARSATAGRRCCSPRTRPTSQRLFGSPNASRYVKDGINDSVVHGGSTRSIRAREGTKAAAHYQAVLQPGRDVRRSGCGSRTRLPRPRASARTSTRCSTRAARRPTSSTPR